MKVGHGLAWAGAFGALTVILVVLGWYQVERRAAVEIVEAGVEGGAVQRSGPAESNGEPPRTAALAAAPDCLAASFKPLERKDIARRFFVELGMPEPNALPRRLIADLAGVDPSAGENRFGIPRLDMLLPSVSGKHSVLGLSRQRPLEDALLEPTLDGFIAIANDEPALMRRGWSHSELALTMRDDSALGHALRVRGGEVLRRIHEIPAAAFGLHEMAAAMARGIDADDFLALLDRSGVDPKATWLPGTWANEPYEFVRWYNLAAYAAVHARPRLLRSLLGRGVALPADRPSVLDELSLSAARPAPDVLIDVVNQLAAAGERPYLPSTAARFAAVAPGVPVPGLHRDAEAVLSSSGLREHAARLAALVARQAAEAEKARAINDHCRDVRLAAGEVGDAPSLASKMAQDEALRERKERWMRANEEKAKGVFSKLGPDALAFIAAVRPAYLADDWDEVFRILDESSHTLPGEFADQLEASFLLHALMEGSKPEVLRELIVRNGGTLPPDAVLTLISSRQDNAVRVAAELETWGLDPGFVDDEGRNAVHHLMDAFRERPDTRPRTLRWLDYLTSRSVSAQPAGPGLDPLDTALFAALDAPEAATVDWVAAVARALILSGASVRSSHRRIAARIRSVAPDAYERLVAALPELRAA